MQTYSHFAKPTFLEKLDIFGIAIAIRFNTLPSHNTRFGGIITLTILGIIFFQFISVSEVLFKQETPQVIQSTDYIAQPEAFALKPETFNFAIGLQDINFNQYMDPSVYNVVGIQQNLVKVLNQTTGLYDQVWTYKNLTMTECTPDNFKIPDSESYFLSQLYQKMYCFDPNEGNAVIEGEFSALVYRAIVLHFNECTDVGCASPQFRNTYLTQPTLGLFMSNNIIQITNKDKPYLSIGKNLYWISGPAFEKYITVNLINNYINSDFAIYGKQWETDRVVSFSSSQESVLPRTSSTMFSVTIVYEKNLETNYYRSYLKLDQAFSSLGGMFNGLLAIGFLLCKPLSQLELNRKLLNAVFNISKEDQEELEKDQMLSPAPRDKPRTQNVELKDSIDHISQSGGVQESQHMKSPPQSNQNMKKSTDLIKSLKQNNVQDPKKQHDINTHIHNFFKVTYSELQIKLRDYLTNYLSFFKRFQTAKQKLITYGTNKLYNQIDIFYIMTKMIELEKLKHLLLNDHQIKLFEYLPRPQLKLDEVIEQEEKEVAAAANAQNKKDENNTLNNSNNMSLNNSPNRPPLKTKTKNKEKKEFKLFSQDEKTPLEKAQDAQRAFNHIQKKTGQKSHIDEKLIRMLDPKLVNMLMENSFDFGQAHDEDDDLEELGKKGLMEKSSILKKSIFQPNDATFKIDKTIVEMVEEEENKDMFNVSGILPKSLQNDLQKMQQSESIAQIEKRSTSLVTSQIGFLPQGQQSIVAAAAAEKENDQNPKQKVRNNTAGNMGENTDYLESNNNLSIFQTPNTTARVYQDNTELMQHDKDKLMEQNFSVINTTHFNDYGEDFKRNEDDNTPDLDIRISKPSATRNYFDENQSEKD